MSDASLSKWVCREVLLRREPILDLHGSILFTDKTKIRKAWDEIGTLAMIRFGNQIKVDDLKRIWARDGNEYIENMNESETAGSPSSLTSRADQGPPEVQVKVEYPEEEEDDYIPQKRRKTTGPSDMAVRNPPPCHAYKVIVREVLRRSALLIDKSNSKSRTPQANHARWTAWQEIRGVVNHECQRDMPVEQIQIIWRHQKQKIPSELIEDAVANPSVIDDNSVDAIFKYYDDKEKWKIDYANRDNQDITLTLKDILPKVEINLGRDRELYDDELPPTLQPQPPRVLKDLLMPPTADIKPAISPPAEPDHSTSRNSIEDSIAAVVRNSAADDRRKTLIDNLIKAKTAYLEQTMKLQKKQIEVMENFNRTVQMLLEER